MDFAARPPEITSGQMYVGAGSGPLLAAAAGWSELGTALHSMAASYTVTIEGLTLGPWTGPSSLMMAAAAAPYVAWLSACAALAEQTAAQASLAAAAYEAAFEATVPPPEIAANRSLLVLLAATNLFGQNTPEIAATETQYGEFWAQDATAMYVYAGSSAAATQLTPFTDPPPTTNPAGTAAAQSAATAQTVASDVQTQLTHLINSLPHALQTFATNTAAFHWPPPLPTWLLSDLKWWNNIWSTLVGPFSPLLGWSGIIGGPFLSFGQVFSYAQNGQGLAAFLSPAKAITGALAPIAESMPHLSSASMGAAPVSGAMGRAALVGGLTVPQGWTQAAPALRTLTSVLPNMTAASAAPLAGEGGVFGEMALSSLAGRAMGAATFSSGGGAVARSLGGVVAEADPATATIIVIPALEE